MVVALLILVSAKVQRLKTVDLDFRLDNTPPPIICKHLFEDYCDQDPVWSYIHRKYSMAYWYCLCESGWSLEAELVDCVGPSQF